MVRKKVHMSENNLSARKVELAYTIACSELKKKNSALSSSAIDKEMQKWLKLSLPDLEKKVKELPSMLSGLPPAKTYGYSAMGLNLSKKPDIKAKVKAAENKFPTAKPKERVTEQTPDKKFAVEVLT